MTYSKPTVTRQRLAGLMRIPSMCLDPKTFDSDECRKYRNS